MWVRTIEVEEYIEQLISKTAWRPEVRDDTQRFEHSGRRITVTRRRGERWDIAVVYVDGALFAKIVRTSWETRLWMRQNGRWVDVTERSD